MKCMSMRRWACAPACRLTACWPSRPPSRTASPWQGWCRISARREAGALGGRHRQSLARTSVVAVWSYSLSLWERAGVGATRRMRPNHSCRQALGADLTFITARIDFSDPNDSAAPRLRYAFGTPRAVLVAHQLAEVRSVLDAVQAAALQGRWCVGYVRYEAAPAFDAALAVHAPDGPLAWFAVFDEALPWPDDATASASAAQEI